MPYLSLFKIRRDERWPALAALVYTITLNVLVIARYADRFMAPADNYHRLFVRTFHISGFDPLTYAVVSNWDTEYNIYRHPLLAFFMYIPNQINQGLMLLTGCNCAQLVVGALLVACSFYAFVFLCRIFHEVVDVTRPDAWLLGGLTFSFAYVMVAVSVPDHFALSMFMLVLTLYLTGRKMQHGRPMRAWQTLLLFTLTAGISLNNGIKTFMACWAANGRRFWRPAHLLLVVALPSALLWGVARLEWYHFERPKYITTSRYGATRRHALSAIPRVCATPPPSTGPSTDCWPRKPKPVKPAKTTSLGKPMWAVPSPKASSHSGPTSPRRGGRRWSKTSSERRCSCTKTICSKTTCPPVPSS